MEEQIKTFNFVRGVCKILFKINQFKSDHCKNKNNNNNNNDNNSQANLMNRNVTNCVLWKGCHKNDGRNNNNISASTKYQWI